MATETQPHTLINLASSISQSNSFLALLMLISGNLAPWMTTLFGSGISKKPASPP
jgi:hypothetical protein